MTTALSAGNPLELRIPERKNAEDLAIRREDNIADLGWLAGIIDGEGCIFLTQYIFGNKYGVTKWIRVENTDMRMIHKISRIYKNLGIQFSYQMITRKNTNANKTLTITVCSYNGIKKLLESVLPYLTSKKDQAEKMLEFIAYRISLPWKGNIGCLKLGELPETKKFIESIKALKKPAIEPSTTVRVASQVLSWR